MKTEITSFNIRVYTLIFNAAQQVLVSDEVFNKKKLIKYPGGGLEFGESIIECIQREAQEEMQQPLKDLQLFYVNEAFIPTRFYPEKQLITIYYTAKLKNSEALSTSTVPFDFDSDADGTQSFRWVDLANLSQEKFSFETDTLVAKKLAHKFLAHE